MKRTKQLMPLERSCSVVRPKTLPLCNGLFTSYIATEESAKQSIDALKRSSVKKQLKLKDLYLSNSGKGGTRSDHLVSMLCNDFLYSGLDVIF